MTKVKTELRLMMSMFKAAESIRRGEKDPLQWIFEQVTESKMEQVWKETMTPKRLVVVEEGRKPKPKPKPVRKAWEDYKEAQRESQVDKRRLWEEAQTKWEGEAEI